ncbi:hypothetical protein DAPPUDRAFT_115373 [Daphnia pulex]|uniref:Uncharacterized protein n=1 Tax=Daphnia pulex TaxID=6669 RepID=E9HL50_DAPPU|nr:hypothetical protein DAPPUDRAFT_115373 [Daphnia pulex]|eukprot:EFX67545.1 hypothetical protein DAPPUDRAFT_115373 [Daphnia pulex]
MRTGDADKMALISTLRDPRLTQPIDDEVVQKLTEKQLTEKYIIEDSEWACAPIVVTLKEVRTYQLTTIWLCASRKFVVFLSLFGVFPSPENEQPARPQKKSTNYTNKNVGCGRFCCWGARIPNSKHQPD